MLTFTVKVEYVLGMELIDVEARSYADALIAVGRILKAKDKIRGYRAMIGLTIAHK